MARSYIRGLVILAQKHLRYLQRHQLIIEQYLDAQGVTDFRACITCATALLATLERIQPGSTGREQA